MERRIGDRRTVGIGPMQVRSWTVIAFVAAVALGGGVLVAGMPTSSEAFVLPDSATSTTSAPATGALASVPVGELSVVIASARGDAEGATTAAEALESLETLGYAAPAMAEAAESSTATVIHFAPGFEDEATRLAGDLDLADAGIDPMPEDPVTVDDAAGAADLVVILGSNA